MVLFWVFLFISFSNAQDISYTGNLVNFTTQANNVTSTWQNAGSIGQPLTCWAWGDPGYCGPQPRVAAWGEGTNIINFSYGMTDLYQLINIKNALPNTGTGLQVNGFNFGFTAKNGNGWDDSRQDYLMAYVKFYDNTNTKVLESYTYNQNWRYNWTSFNYSETFKTPYPVPQLGNAQIGFIGMDNNYWVGPYGPEIQNTYFSLKYSVDPCATNVYYSPSCAGYYDALAKLAPATTTTTVTTVEYAPPLPPPDAPPPPPNSTPLPGPPPPPGAPAPVGSGPAPTVAPTVAISTTQEKTTAVGPGLGFALNLIAKNSEREKAIAQQAVATSIAEAQSAGDKAQTIAIATASASVSMSTTSMETTSSGTGIQVTNSISKFNTLNSVNSQPSNITILQNPQTTINSSSASQVAIFQLAAPTSIESIQNTQNFGLFEIQVQRQQDPEIPQQTTNFMTDRNNPLREIIQPTPMQQLQQEQQTTTVNRNAQPNEVAVGVVLERMAVVPTGYANYTNFALKDASFYSEKPLYANQRVIDNVRVLRGLGSDIKHQELVSLQYK